MIGRIAIAALFLGLTAAPAQAASQRDVSYPYDQVFSATVRFLRIDEGYTISERDREAGYILFVVEDGGHKFRGALELIRHKDAKGRDGVRLFVRISNRPAYMERGLLSRLEKKLREQLGPPAPAPKPAPDEKEKPPEA